MALLLLTILLLEGFITISVEVLTIRQLMPFFGGSVLITSIIIGVFLLFLALGYWRGGVCHQDYLQRLRRNFALSFIWVGIGLSYSFISLYYHVFVVKFAVQPLFSLFVYLLFALAPVVCWMGQTVPIATNLFNQKQSISRISGSALFLSTIGSFLGALLTSLLLFQYLGVAWTVVINCLLLFLLIMYVSFCSEWHLSSLIALLLGLMAIIYVNLSFEKHFFEKTNNYANYQVVEQLDFNKLFVINNSASSQITPDNKGFRYIELIKKIIFEELEVHNQKILVIGAGGFTLSVDGTHNNQVMYVDIDPEIKKVVENSFLKAPIQGQFTGMDARQFFQKNHEKWRIVLTDAYSNKTTIPAMLLTREYFQAIKEHLTKDGYMIANMIIDPNFRDRYSQMVDNTIRSVFPYCHSIPLSYDDPSANVIYVCPNIETHEKSIYTDDLTTSTFDYFKSQNR